MGQAKKNSGVLPDVCGERLNGVEGVELPPGDVAALLSVVCRKSLREFCKHAWAVVDPAPMVWEGCHDAICDVLEAVTAGHIKKLCISIAPRHSKSTITSVMWPAWEWATNYGQTWLCVGMNYDLAVRDSVKCRSLLESKWYRELFRARILASQSRQEKFYTTSNGHRISGALGGVGTGDGGNRIIYDDPMAIEDRFSEAKRKSVIDYWDTTLEWRVNDPHKGARVVIAQRLHLEDLIGHLKEKDYVQLVLPEEFDPPRKCVIDVPGFKWSDWRTEAGQLLAPVRFPREVVEDIKKGPPQRWSALYQQDPVPAGGEFLKREWFKYFSETLGADGPSYVLGERIFSVKRCSHFFATMDPASQEKGYGKGEPCYSVLCVFDRTPDNDLLLLHVYRRQVEAPTLVADVKGLQSVYPFPVVYVEATGLGLPIVQVMRKEGLAVRELRTKFGKEARGEATAAAMTGGKVWFRHGAVWLGELERELETFPGARFRDQFDALAHGCAVHLGTNNSPPPAGVVSFSGASGQAVHVTRPEGFAPSARH